MFLGSARQLKGAGAKAPGRVRLPEPGDRLQQHAVQRDRPQHRAVHQLRGQDRQPGHRSRLSARATSSGSSPHLSTTTAALASQRVALGSSLRQLPGFMRLANTTFVNLRTALNDLTPLVNVYQAGGAQAPEAARPAAPAGRQDSVPTVRDLSNIIHRPGASNDLIELTKLGVPLAAATVRHVMANGKTRAGAFPQSIAALNGSTPELATARPYAVDLTGWFEGFTHPGQDDANGGDQPRRPERRHRLDLQRRAEHLRQRRPADQPGRLRRCARCSPSAATGRPGCSPPARATAARARWSAAPSSTRRAVTRVIRARFRRANEADRASQPSCSPWRRRSSSSPPAPPTAAPTAPTRSSSTTPSAWSPAPSSRSRASRAGTIKAINLDQKTLHAVVTVSVTRAGFGHFHQSTPPASHGRSR